MHFPNLSIFKDLRLFKFTLLVCWMATWIIGYNRFIDQDVLLSVSVIGEAPMWLSAVVACVVFGFPVLALFFRDRGVFYIIAVAFFAVFVLLDVNRLTPYFVFYLGVFGVYVFRKKDQQLFYKSLTIIASGIYIASGLHKLNPGFAKEILPLIWFNSLPIKPSENIGYFIAIIEAVLGFGLLFNKTRKVSCLLLIVTHLIVLWKLGPFKLSWNLIVWPWNFAMIALLSAVYSYKNSNLFLTRTGMKSHFLALFFFWCLPLFSLFHLVPDNLGFKLYSGEVLNPLLRLETKLDDLKSMDYESDNNVTSIMLQDYSISTSQLAISPEPWIFERIKSNFEKKYQTTGTLIYNSTAYRDRINYE